MRRLVDLWRDEPAAVNALVAAVIGLATVLGLALPVGFAAALMAVLTALSGLATRAKVTPVRRQRTRRS